MRNRASSLRCLPALFAAFSAAMFQSFSPAAAEDSFPTRSLTYIVAFPPGGPPDLIARMVAPAMSEILGKPIVIENRPGASAAIAAAAAMRADPDGHTLLTADLSLVVSPLVIANAGYDPLKDFKLVVMTARTGSTLVIDPKSSITSIADLVATAKRDPDSIKAAHTGIGTPPHLTLVSFLQATGTRVLQVPYKGSAQAIQDVVAGHITLLCTGPSTSVALARDGKVRMLAVTGSARLPSLPDVPTFAEAGIDMGGMSGGQYFGIGVRAETSPGIIDKLNAAANKALASLEVREKMAKLDIEPVGGTADEFTTFFKSQSTYWREALTSAGISSH